MRSIRELRKVGEVMSVGVHRGPGARGLAVAAALLLAVAAACQPSAPPGFSGTQQPAGSGPGAPGASVAAPNGSDLVAGKPVVTTDGGVVTAVGLSAGKTP